MSNRHKDIKRVTTKSGSHLIAVAEFNNGHSHIAEDADLWVVLHGLKPSPHITAEAMQALRRLPDSPDQYAPLQKFKALENRPSLKTL